MLTYYAHTEQLHLPGDEYAEHIFYVLDPSFASKVIDRANKLRTRDPRAFQTNMHTLILQGTEVVIDRLPWYIPRNRVQFAESENSTPDSTILIERRPLKEGLPPRKY